MRTKEKSPTHHVAARFIFPLLILLLLSAPAAGERREPPDETVPSPPIIKVLPDTKDGRAMVFVPGGRFTQGSYDGNPQELPVRKVFISPFWMDRDEVSVAGWERFRAATGHRASKYARDETLHIIRCFQYLVGFDRILLPYDSTDVGLDVFLVAHELTQRVQKRTFDSHLGEMLVIGLRIFRPWETSQAQPVVDAGVYGVSPAVFRKNKSQELTPHRGASLRCEESASRTMGGEAHNQLFGRRKFTISTLSQTTSILNAVGVAT